MTNEEIITGNNRINKKDMNTKFKTGISGNPKGRPKGSQNKINKEAKEAFNLVMEMLQKRMLNNNDVIDRLTPFQVATMYVNLLNYFKPKLTRNSNQNLIEGELNIVVSYVDNLQ